MGGTAAGNDSLLMSVSPDSSLSEGDHVDVALDRAKIHLFDEGTDLAITHGVSQVAGATADARGEEAE